MYANVNQKACIQCGLCPSICPEVFSLDDGAPAHAITDAVPEDCRLSVDGGVVRNLTIPQSPSVTAPFTQGGLIFYPKNLPTSRKIMLYKFDFLWYAIQAC